MKITEQYLVKVIKEELDAAMVQEAAGETAQDVADRLKNIPVAFRASALRDFEYMADGETDMASYYPHVEDLKTFATEVLRLVNS